MGFGKPAKEKIQLQRGDLASWYDQASALERTGVFYGSDKHNVYLLVDRSAWVRAQEMRIELYKSDMLDGVVREDNFDPNSSDLTILVIDDRYLHNAAVVQKAWMSETTTSALKDVIVARLEERAKRKQQETQL